jgi:hypothetical protein
MVIKSVGDMAQLFVCIENIPMFTAMKIFNLNSVISGQERSTRYQNFENPQYIRYQEICNNQKIRKEYEKIILKQMNDYYVLLKKTKEIFKEILIFNEDIKEEKSAYKQEVLIVQDIFFHMVCRQVCCSYVCKKLV